MNTIRPVSDLRNNFAEISKVFIPANCYSPCLRNYIDILLEQLKKLKKSIKKKRFRASFNLKYLEDVWSS